MSDATVTVTRQVPLTSEDPLHGLAGRLLDAVGDAPTWALIVGGVAAWYLAAAVALRTSARVRSFTTVSDDPINLETFWVVSPVAAVVHGAFYAVWTTLWVLSVGIVRRPYLPKLRDEDAAAAKVRQAEKEEARKAAVVREDEPDAPTTETDAPTTETDRRPCSADFRPIREFAPSGDGKWLYIDTYSLSTVQDGSQSGSVLIRAGGQLLLVAGVDTMTVLAYLNGEVDDPGYDVPNNLRTDL